MQQAQQQEQKGISAGVKNLFLMLQGSYGAPFLAKFSSGVKDDQGRDLGIRSTMKVWDARLAKFPADVLATAYERVIVESPEFPPSLPLIEKICEAAMPRKTYAQEQGLPALPAPKVEPVQVNVQKRDDGKDWARKILARVEAGDKSICRYSRESAELALGRRAQMS
jgi:hypothetical protein